MERPYKASILHGRSVERPYIEMLSEHLLLARTSAAIFTIALCFFLFFGFHQCHRSIYPVGECGLIRINKPNVKNYFYFLIKTTAPQAIVYSPKHRAKHIGTYCKRTYRFLQIQS